MSELSDSDRRHLEGWNAEGYGFEVTAHVRCLWCDYVAVGINETEAIRQYFHEHEDVIRAKANEAHRDFLGG